MTTAPGTSQADYTRITKVLDQLRPHDRARALDMLEVDVRDTAWPVIERVDLSDTTDPLAEREWVWQCPYEACRSASSDGEGFKSVDTATRWCGVSGWDAADPASTPLVDGEGYGDYDDLYWMCESCQQPVSLPAGIKPRWF